MCVSRQVTSTRAQHSAAAELNHCGQITKTGRGAVGSYHRGRVLIKSHAGCTAAKIIMGILQLET